MGAELVSGVCFHALARCPKSLKTDQSVRQDRCVALNPVWRGYERRTDVSRREDHQQSERDRDGSIGLCNKECNRMILML